MIWSFCIEKWMFSVTRKKNTLNTMRTISSGAFVGRDSTNHAAKRLTNIYDAIIRSTSIFSVNYYISSISNNNNNKIYNELISSIISSIMRWTMPMTHRSKCFQWNDETKWIGMNCVGFVMPFEWKITGIPRPMGGNFYAERCCKKKTKKTHTIH